MISVDRLTRPARATATFDTPLEHLLACHERIEEKLCVLERAVAALEDRPEEAHAAILTVFRHFDTAGVRHTQDEERSLFPRLREHLDAAGRQYLETLEDQHREAEDVYAMLHDVPAAGTDPAGYQAIASRFCALYREHMASESRELIAAARRVLGEEELETLALEMQERRESSR
jgi:hemerythrin-like domain-containing protein